jgi:hypothetical protein
MMEPSKLQVYDPPMCCSTGVCGPDVNTDLVRFAADLDWLKQQGVEVERFNLSSNPAAFARNQAVREALQYEGNTCLPLIIVNGEIVSRCVYPTRSELMAFVGLTPKGKGEQPADSNAAAVPPYLKSESLACGPGCDCAPPAKGKTMKVVVSVAILLAVGAILIYKVSSTKNPANNAAQASAVFNLGQTASQAQPEAGSQPTETSKSVMGEYLNSLNALNQVAMDKDVVFVYIPGQGEQSINGNTNNAVLAAQNTMGKNNINLGLYTLETGSPDYSTVSAQVQSPAVLIAVKGKGMTSVSGEVTETKLLQAYTASCSAGGCGSGGCGPSGCP